VSAMGRGAAAVAAAACAALAACAPAGPAYHRPDAPAPADWQTPAPWRPGEPRDTIPKGAWWTMFADADLGALEDRLVDANQTLKEAAAHYEQARALAALALSANVPNIAVSFSAGGQRLSATRAGGNDQAAVQGSFSLPLSVSYEVDLFGKRLRSIEAAQASLDAAAAARENVRLVLTSELAADYFTLRRLDTELGILDEGVTSETRALDLIRARHDGGIASGLDVAQEETVVASTRTQATLLRQQRDQVESAVLTGQPATGFHVASGTLAAAAPAIDTGLPSDLLERRPDVAEAEREVAAANARIGVARSAYYPSLNLIGDGGWQSGNLLKLFNLPSLIWGVGAAVTQNLVDGGARHAQVAFAEADYDATVAAYRETVLEALSEVRDDLDGLGVLGEASASQATAVDAATRQLALATDRYTGGLATALDVVSAQQTLLANQRLAAELQGDQLVTTVLLVKALGGGWK